MMAASTRKNITLGGVTGVNTSYPGRHDLPRAAVHDARRGDDLAGRHSRHQLPRRRSVVPVRTRARDFRRPARARSRSMTAATSGPARRTADFFAASLRSIRRRCSRATPTSSSRRRGRTRPARAPIPFARCCGPAASCGAAPRTAWPSSKRSRCARWPRCPTRRSAAAWWRD